MSWESFFKEETQKDYYKALMDFVNKEYEEGVCYPPREYIFRAFDLTPTENIKAVIIGQDPYHGEGEAEGLCFSVGEGIKIPPSLLNIYKELAMEYEGYSRQGGSLTDWARQGVLLLNSVMTVQKDKANSHKKQGWETFTTNVIKYVNTLDRPIAYLLWGNYAKQYAKYITNKNHLVLTAAHPSPLSANRGGFFGCNHFIKTNEFLVNNGVKEIKW